MFLVVVYSLVVITICAVVFVQVREVLQQIRGRKMLKLARKRGPVLVRNTEKGVVGVCSYKRYKEAEKVWFERPNHEQDEKRRAELLTEKKEILVKPTFTFYYDDSSFLMAYTAHRMHLEVLKAQLVKKVTGYGRKDVDDNSYDAAVEILIERKPDLLIPFMRPVLAGLDRAAQVRYFRYSCAQDALNSLLADV